MPAEINRLNNVCKQNSFNETILELAMLTNTLIIIPMVVPKAILGCTKSNTSDVYLNNIFVIK